jgi:hypothetical protein
MVTWCLYVYPPKNKVTNVAVRTECVITKPGIGQDVPLLHRICQLATKLTLATNFMAESFDKIEQNSTGY